jgi:hypothetical protein
MALTQGQIQVPKPVGYGFPFGQEQQILMQRVRDQSNSIHASVGSGGLLLKGVNCTTVRSGTGSYRINFTTPMVDANYNATVTGVGVFHATEVAKTSGYYHFTVNNVGSSPAATDAATYVKITGEFPT